MAYNEALTDRVREALADAPSVEEKRMFRGVLFMVDGKMCISTGDDELMCRIDPAIHDKAVEQPGVRTVVMKGRDYKGYVYVDVNNLKTEDEFQYWIGLALDYNKIAKASKKNKK